MNNKSSNFLQPVISVFGLAFSLMTTLIPIFSRSFISRLFINEDLTTFSSFLAFILGIAIVWQMIQFQPYINISVRGKMIGPTGISWVLMFLCILLGTLFFYIGLEFKGSSNNLLQTTQSLIYILFFLTLIGIFSILFSQTKQRYNWEENRDNFPTTLFQTLSKSGLVKPYIEIYENNQIFPKELLEKENVNSFIPLKRIKVKTLPQSEEIIEFISSTDGKEIVKILKKGS